MISHVSIRSMSDRISKGVGIYIPNVSTSLSSVGFDEPCGFNPCVVPLCHPYVWESQIAGHDVRQPMSTVMTLKGLARGVVHQWLLRSNAPICCLLPPTVSVSSLIVLSFLPGFVGYPPGSSEQSCKCPSNLSDAWLTPLRKTPLYFI